MTSLWVIGTNGQAVDPASIHARFNTSEQLLSTAHAASRHFFFLIHRSHSISFTRAQGIPKYKIRFGTLLWYMMRCALVFPRFGHGKREI